MPIVFQKDLAVGRKRGSQKLSFWVGLVYICLAKKVYNTFTETTKFLYESKYKDIRGIKSVRADF
jgi:hypothetical protein